MSSIPFLFGLHNHQPIGNFDNVINQLTDRCYLPFLKIVKDYQFFKFSLHISGPLLSWWKNNYTEVIDLIAEMSERDQVELFGGGFYEPILAVWNSEDRIEQITILSNEIKRLFGQTPTGLWLTERVWEQQIVEDIVKCGIKYVVVDDRHFIVSGFKKEDLYSYYLTESNDAVVSIFPIDEQLRYLIPFREPEKLEEYLKKIRACGDMAIYFDDGEKFGAWPGTYKWVYEDKWLNRFLEYAERWQNELIEFKLFKDVLNEIPAKGICYLPTASYEEMEQWSLPYEASLMFKRLKERFSSQDLLKFTSFLRGGHWKNFFVKYPESNYMHKRVKILSKKVYKSNNKQARDLILAAQCNDAYWHGIFGGLYLPHLRNAIWSSLLSAESLVRDSSFSCDCVDIDLDGKKEIIFGSNEIIWVFNSITSKLIELSLPTRAHNYLNVLTRRAEFYHDEIRRRIFSKKEDGESKKEDTHSFSIHEIDKKVDPELISDLSYDWYKRDCFVDHFFDISATLLDFKRCDFKEIGDFANQPFNYNLDIKNLTVSFVRNGGIYPSNTLPYAVELSKSFRFENSGHKVVVSYEIRNLDNREINGCFFGVEWNLFPGYLITGKGRVFLDDIERPAYHSWEASGSKFLIEDDGINNKLFISLESPANFWMFPIKTVSQSEQDYDRTIQGISLMAFWPFKLKPKNRNTYLIELTCQS